MLRYVRIEDDPIYLTRYQLLRQVPIVAMIVAGLVHFVIAPSHYQHAEAHGIFLTLAGVSQLLWALAFRRYTSPKLPLVGMALSGCMVCLWLLTLVAAPFEQEPLSIGLADLTTKISEFIGFLALVSFVCNGRRPLLGTVRPIGPVLAGALVIVLLTGVAAWGGGHIAEAVYPDLGHDHESGVIPGDGHGHGEDGAAEAHDVRSPGEDHGHDDDHVEENRGRIGNLDLLLFQSDSIAKGTTDWLNKNKFMKGRSILLEDLVPRPSNETKPSSPVHYEEDHILTS